MRLIAHGQADGIRYLDLLAPALVLLLAFLSRRRRDAILLGTAAVALLGVILPPMQQIAERSVTGHMIQHLVIIIVAAPLLGLVAAEAPSRLRGRRWLRSLATATIAPLYAPLVAGTVHAAVIFFWHVPILYDAAVDSWFIHGPQHATLLGSGVWWWTTVVHHSARRAPIGAMISLFVVATICAVLGVMMMFASDAWYGQGGLEDQQLAGAAMSSASGAIGGGTAMLLVARTVRRLDTPRQPRIRAPQDHH